MNSPAPRGTIARTSSPAKATRLTHREIPDWQSLLTCNNLLSIENCNAFNTTSQIDRSKCLEKLNMKRLLVLVALIGGTLFFGPSSKAEAQGFSPGGYGGYGYGGFNTSPPYGYRQMGDGLGQYGNGYGQYGGRYPYGYSSPAYGYGGYGQYGGYGSRSYGGGRCW